MKYRFSLPKNDHKGEKSKGHITEEYCDVLKYEVYFLHQMKYV